MATEVWFYHLQRQPLEAVLPGLLERTLERGWRAVVQAGTVERVAALDAHLWSYSDESFLPHGAEAASGADQPIYLTADDANPNSADVRFCVDGAGIAGVEGYRRVMALFDGNDPAAVAQARTAWTELKSAGHDVAYWQQNPSGKWEKRA